METRLGYKAEKLMEQYLSRGILRDIILEIVKEENLSFKMALIYTDVDKKYVTKKLSEGRIYPLGPQLKLTSGQS